MKWFSFRCPTFEKIERREHAIPPNDKQLHFAMKWKYIFTLWISVSVLITFSFAYYTCVWYNSINNMISFIPHSYFSFTSISMICFLSQNCFHWNIILKDIIVQLTKMWIIIHKKVFSFSCFYDGNVAVTMIWYNTCNKVEISFSY